MRDEIKTKLLVAGITNRLLVQEKAREIDIPNLEFIANGSKLTYRQWLKYLQRKNVGEIILFPVPNREEYIDIMQRHRQLFYRDDSCLTAVSKDRVEYYILNPGPAEDPLSFTAQSIFGPDLPGKIHDLQNLPDARKPAQPILAQALVELNETLAKISTFAEEQNMENFKTFFACVDPKIEYGQFADYEELSRYYCEDALKLLAGERAKGAFGGMGSWNDSMGNEEVTKNLLALLSRNLSLVTRFGLNR